MMGAERCSMVMTEAQKSYRPRTTKRGPRIRPPGAGNTSAHKSDDYPARSCAGRDLLPAREGDAISASRQKLVPNQHAVRRTSGGGDYLRR